MSHAANRTEHSVAPGSYRKLATPDLIIKAFLQFTAPNMARSTDVDLVANQCDDEHRNLLRKIMWRARRDVTNW